MFKQKRYMQFLSFEVSFNLSFRTKIHVPLNGVNTKTLHLSLSDRSGSLCTAVYLIRVKCVLMTSSLLSSCELVIQ